MNQKNIVSIRENFVKLLITMRKPDITTAKTAPKAAAQRG